MKKIITIAMALALCVGAFAQQAEMPAELEAPATEKAAKKEKSAVGKHLENHFKFYGFIRNYFAYDTHESIAGTGDLYYWFPKDQLLNAAGEDLNQVSSFRFLTLTTRAGVDVSGYQAGGYSFGAKIEADFYAGLTGSTGTAQLRLRQAFVTVAKDWRNWKIGQAWHPMAADLPDIFSLESGAPFGPFSRTPQVTFTANLNKGFSLTAAAIWQMQYCSSGPTGPSANYIKYSCTPECYFGVNWSNNNVLLRLGGDVLSIKPYNTRSNGTDVVKVSDRVTSGSLFQYGQYKLGEFTLKEKLVYGNDGSHFNLIGGYGATDVAADGVSWNYTSTNVATGWTTLQWKRKDCPWVPQMFVGYMYNFGTAKPIMDGNCWSKHTPTNDSALAIGQMFRIQPEVLYNIGKFQIGLEYMLTQVQYGDSNKVWMHPTDNLHWVANHRIQAMVKFNF